MALRPARDEPLISSRCGGFRGSVPFQVVHLQGCTGWTGFLDMREPWIPAFAGMTEAKPNELQRYLASGIMFTRSGGAERKIANALCTVQGVSGAA